MSVSAPNSPRHNCVLCGAMLQNDSCEVCGVEQGDAESVILESSRLWMFSLCERVRTTTSFDVETKEIFQRIADVQTRVCP